MSLVQYQGGHPAYPVAQYASMGERFIKESRDTKEREKANANFQASKQKSLLEHDYPDPADRAKMLNVRVTHYGKRMNGTPGITGVLEGHLMPHHIEAQHANAKKRGEHVSIESLDNRQPEVDALKPKD